MNIRDATEADVEAVASLGELSTDAVQTLLHDRTLWVATSGDKLTGFLVFTINQDAVHISKLGGEKPVISALIGRLIEYANANGLPIETVVPNSETAVRDALSAAGFIRIQSGPEFLGQATHTYQFTTSQNDEG